MAISEKSSKKPHAFLLFISKTHNNIFIDRNKLNILRYSNRVPHNNVPITVFQITKFLITKFLITKSLITKFLITKFLITKFLITTKFLMLQSSLFVNAKFICFEDLFESHVCGRTGAHTGAGLLGGQGFSEDRAPQRTGLLGGQGSSEDRAPGRTGLLGGQGS
jgi:hypothetical protein